MASLALEDALVPGTMAGGIHARLEEPIYGLGTGTVGYIELRVRTVIVSPKQSRKQYRLEIGLSDGNTHSFDLESDKMCKVDTDNSHWNFPDDQLRQAQLKISNPYDFVSIRLMDDGDLAASCTINPFLLQNRVEYRNKSIQMEPADSAVAEQSRWSCTVELSVRTEISKLAYFFAHFNQRRLEPAFPKDLVQEEIRTTAGETSTLQLQTSLRKAITDVVNDIWPIVVIAFGLMDLSYWTEPQLSLLAIVIWCVLCLRPHLFFTTAMLVLVAIMVHSADQLVSYEPFLRHFVTPTFHSRLRSAPQTDTVAEPHAVPAQSGTAITATISWLRSLISNLRIVDDVCTRIRNMFVWASPAITMNLFQYLVLLVVVSVLLPVNIIFLVGGLYMLLSRTPLYLGLYLWITKQSPASLAANSLWVRLGAGQHKAAPR